MIGLLAVGGVSAIAGMIGGAVAGARSAEKRTIEARERELARMVVESRATQARWERRDADLHAVADRLRRACMLPSDATPRARADRPTPRDLEGLVARLRGFAFVDSAIVADGAGLVVSRDESPEGRDNATLVPAVLALASAVEALGFDAVDVRVVTSDARDVTSRLLPAWTGRAVLVAQSTSRPVNPAALDAVAAWAESIAPSRDVRTALLERAGALRGATGTYGNAGARSQALFEELERLRATVAGSAACFAHEGRIVLGVVENGPGEAVCADLCARLWRFHAVAQRALRANGIVRVEIGTPDGHRIALAPLVDHSGFAVLTLGPTVAQDVEITRFLGRTRRLLAAGGTDRRLLEAPKEVQP